MAGFMVDEEERNRHRKCAWAIETLICMPHTIKAYYILSIQCFSCNGIVKSNRSIEYSNMQLKIDSFIMHFISYVPL